MADVYKARCHKLNRYVAIKVLRREYCDNESFVRKFTVEAQSTAGLTHPNIVNIYDAGNEEGVHYIVMELAEGMTLKTIYQTLRKTQCQRDCRLLQFRLQADCRQRMNITLFTEILSRRIFWYQIVVR